MAPDINQTPACHLPQLFEEAAQEKHADAMYMRGVQLEYGLGVDQDEAAAVKLFLLAGQAGHSDALYHAGLMFAYGRGVHQDFTRAGVLFQAAVGAPVRATVAAAEQLDTQNATALGHVGAALQLGIMSVYVM